VITAVSWAVNHPAAVLAGLAGLLALSGAALAATFRTSRRGGDR
jgi:hypothetical protein